MRWQSNERSPKPRMQKVTYFGERAFCMLEMPAGDTAAGSGVVARNG